MYVFVYEIEIITFPYCLFLPLSLSLTPFVMVVDSLSNCVLALRNVLIVVCCVRCFLFFWLLFRISPQVSSFCNYFWHGIPACLLDMRSVWKRTTKQTTFLRFLWHTFLLQHVETCKMLLLVYFWCFVLCLFFLTRFWKKMTHKGCFFIHTYIHICAYQLTLGCVQSI